MTFGNVILSVQKYLRVESTETRDLIKIAIKESIKDFVRIHEWKLIREAVELSLGDETSYDVSVMFAQSWAITAVNTTDKTFTVSGNITPVLAVDGSLVVAGSTGNNGTYTIVSSVYGSGSTVITVAEAIVSAVADGTIALSTPLAPFSQEDALIKSDGTELFKNDYRDYLKLTSKSGFWSIFGTTLYSSGNGSVTFLYFSEGVEPSEDTDEPKVLQHYWDAIMRLAVVHFLRGVGDVDAMKLETASLNIKIETLRSSESRQSKRGALHHVGRL